MLQTSFDIEEFVSRSRPLDLSGVEWRRAREYPLSPAELRILPYFIDVEAYTIGYLRALLNTAAGQDPEICAFLACWVYEEAYHGRALERLLREAGNPLDPTRQSSIARPARVIESLKDWAAVGVSALFGKDFVGVHMTWGAINELTTLNGYRRLAEKTANPVLAEVIRRIMRDEARHFGFYYHQAEKRLSGSAVSRRTAAFLISRFWSPVGSGIMPVAETDILMTYLFGGAQGRGEMRHVDETIARLPGMGWFRGLERSLAASVGRMAALPEAQELALRHTA